MREVGMWLNCNQYDGLYVREITSCLSPVLHIYDVPDHITITDLARIMKAQNMGYDDFGYEYGQHVLLPKHRWPIQGPRFGFKLAFNTLLQTVDESYRREVECYAQATRQHLAVL